MSRTDDEDSGLFRDAVRDVRPLRRDNLVPPRASRPPPRPLQREADERAVLKEMMEDGYADTGEELAFRAPGVQDATWRRLRRGAYGVRDELDLHGMTWEVAKRETGAFLDDSRNRNVRCVRIIHGKGLRSKGDGPVLKQRLDGWLRRRNEVLAYCSARPQHGGTGAVYVLLRRA